MLEVHYSDLIRTVNNILHELYPKITRYGNDTVDKAIPPYFFVECVPAGINRQTKNILHKTCSILITYVQRIPDQVDNLAKAEEIAEKLGMLLFVNDRKLRVLQYSHEYIGDNNNILQISFGLDWWEDARKEPAGEKEEKMEHFHTRMVTKGE